MVFFDGLMDFVNIWGVVLPMKFVGVFSYVTPRFWGFLAGISLDIGDENLETMRFFIEIIDCFFG